jgi:hypothetical protein
VNANGSSKDPVARALDFFLYAPIGLAVTVAYRVPKLVADARSQLSETEKRLAGIGHMAVTFGQFQVKREVDSRLAEARRRAEQVTGSVPGLARREGEEGVFPAPNGDAVLGFPSAPAPGDAEPAGPSPARLAAAEALPIPAYDGLSASQVVQRLTGLGPEELEAVRAYEESGRARKTVLTAIDRLRA